MMRCLSWPFKGSGKIFTAVLVLVLIMGASVLIGLSQPALAQEDEPEEGDYRSIDSGYWNVMANWEVYENEEWVDATDYPGHEAGDYTVTIQSGHNIDDNNVGTLYFGDLIIYGHLSLSHYLTLDSTEYLLVDGEYFNGIDTRTGGAIYWYAKVRLSLPADATLDVRNIKDDYGQVIDGLGLYVPHAANNNMRIRIGGVDYAAAVGGGNVVYTFDMINAAGGALAAIATADPDDIEYSGVVLQTTLAGEATGLGSDPAEAELQFYWTGTGPGSFNFNSYEQNPGLVDLDAGGGVTYAGEYTFTFTVTSTYAGFTYSTSDDAVVIVHPAPLTITANDQIKVYGETLIFDGTEFVAIGLLYGDNVTSVTLTSDGSASDAATGTYAIEPSAAVGTILENYDITYVNGNLTVTQMALTITADEQTKVYGETFIFAGTEFEATGLLNGDIVTSVTLTSDGSASDAVAETYTIVPSAAVGTGLEKYDITYVNGTLTVTPKALTITANDQTKEYGETFTFAGTEFEATGLLNVDGVTSVTLTSDGSASDAAAGTYAIVLSEAVGTGLENYDITYINGNLIVTPKALTITADDQTKVYGETFTFAGTEFEATGLLNTDTVTSVTLISSGAIGSATVDGSPYSIVPSAAVGIGLGNYTISYANGTLTVTPKALTITANDQTKFYGETFTFSGAEFEATGLVNADTITSVTLISSGAIGSATVDGSPYSIVPGAAAGIGLGNYTISYANGNLTVTPKALTITANDQTKFYGETFTFNGTEFEASGLVNADTITSVTLTSAGAAFTTGVGGYYIEPSAAVGTGLENYDITYVNGNLTVTPKALTITANDQTKVYGNTFTFNGTEFVTTGLLNADTVDSITLTSDGAASTAVVGTYAIVLSEVVGTGLENYDITYSPGTLTITTKPLIITANDQTKIYGDTFTFSGTEFVASGLVNADTVDSVTLSSNGAAFGAAIGDYPIVPSNAVGMGLENYTISYVNGNFTVNKTIVVCILSSSASTVNYGRLVTFTATVTDTGATGTATFKDGDTVLGSSMLTNGMATYSTSDLSIASHSITAVYGGDANFVGCTSSPIYLKVNKGINWLIGLIILALVVTGLVIFFLWRRRRRAALLAS